MCVSSNPFNLLSIVQNTLGTWSGQSVINSVVFNPAGLPTGVYTLTYTNPSKPDALLCPHSSTVSVSVLNPPTPQISQAGPFCSVSGAVQLSVSPSTGSWVPAPYLNSNGMFTPSLCPVGNNIVQYIIGTPTCNAQHSRLISVEAFVPASITGDIADQCNTSPMVNLTPVAANNLGVWSGTGVNGAAFDPATAGAGYHTLVYQTASSPSGLCPDQATVAVKVFSLAAPIINNAGPFCNTSAPVQLTVSPVGGIFEGGNTSAVNSSGVFNPALAAIGNNLINYSISVGPCIAYAQAGVTVERFVSADLAKQVSTSYCRNATAFNLNSLVQNPGGVWSSPGQNPGITGNMFDPAKANIGSDNLFVYYTHSAGTPSLCPDSSSVRITVKDLPEVTINSSSYKSCAPMEVVLNSPSYNTGKGIWHVTDGSEPKSGLTVTHLFTSPGTYSVTFEYAYEDAQGCAARATLPQEIVVLESPSASFNFSADELSLSDPSVRLLNTTPNLTSTRFEWEVEGQKPIYELHPLVTFTQVGMHRVTLKATTIHSCTSQMTRLIEVKNDFNVFIPSSFTPNQDGLNDVFMPVFSEYGLDKRTYEMQIFDRWGEMIFHTLDATKGWNGTFQNRGDIVLKQDNYVYKIKFRDLDGKLYTKTGYVTLLVD